MKSRFIKTGQSLGLSARHLGALWKELKMWERSSGEEWTVKRLKTLKSIALNTYTPPEGSGYCAGPWGNFVTSCSTTLRAKLLMTNFYLSYYAKKPTESQLDKFYSSLGRSADTNARMNDAAKTELESRIPSGPFRADVDILSHKFSYHKSIPTCGRSATRLTEYHLGDDISNFADSEPLMAWFNRWRSVNTEMCPDIEHWISAFVTEDTHPFVGDIQYIQEGGYKLRAIANPIRVGQWYLDPLKEFLFKMVSRIPEDCTFEQGKGIRKVKSMLLSGRTCHCFDLSDATNNIPYSYTREILSTLQDWFALLEGYGSESFTRFSSLVELFDTFSNSSWLTPEGKDVTFRRGQPLGSGPSFALLALTHHCVMWQIGALPGQYVILGDDIVIFEDILADRYKEYMVGTLGVPIQLSKSIISSTTAEFAGKVITSSSVLSKYRWDPIRVTTVIDVLKYHGTRAIPWIPESMKTAALTVSTLPRHLGGLGWQISSSLESLIDIKAREIIMDRIKEEPLTRFLSKRERLVLIYGRLVDKKSLVDNHWSIQQDLLGEEPQHPWYNVKYTNGVPKGAERYYIPCSNPNSVSSSSLVRQIQRMN